MGPAPLTFDVWSDGGRPPTATEVHDGADSAVVDDGPARRPTAVPTDRGRSLALVVAVLAATAPWRPSPRSSSSASPCGWATRSG